MDDLEIYEADVGWAKSVELVCPVPCSGTYDFEFKLDPQRQYDFLVGALTSPDGHRLPSADLSVAIQDPLGGTPFAHSRNDPDTYVQHSPDGRLEALATTYVPADMWRINLTSPEGITPAAFHLAAVNARELETVKPPPGAAPVTFRCKACKITNKVVAGTCIAAAGVHVIPHAVVGILISHFGLAGPKVALAFIKTAAGAAMDTVAERLCGFIRLCP